MLKLHKEVVVKAPVEKVFGYIAKPENLPQIWPSLYEVSKVERSRTAAIASRGSTTWSARRSRARPRP